MIIAPAGFVIPLHGFESTSSGPVLPISGYFLRLHLVELIAEFSRTMLFGILFVGSFAVVSFRHLCHLSFLFVASRTSCCLGFPYRNFSLRLLHLLGFPLVVSGLLRPRLVLDNNLIITSRASSEDWPNLHRDSFRAAHGMYDPVLSEAVTWLMSRPQTTC